MNRLLVLACSQKKSPAKKDLPALQRYDGPAFRVVRKFLREEDSSPLTILILSAKYGLIAPSRRIPDYDCRMSAARSRALREKVQHRIKLSLSAGHWTEVGLCMGKQYRRTLEGFEQFVPARTRVRYILGGQGERLTELYRWLRNP